MNFQYICSAWAKATADNNLMDSQSRIQLQRRVLSRQLAYNLLMVAGNGNPEGIEMRNADGKEWAFVTRDESSALGTWRLQTFGSAGFKSAQYFDSLQEAAETMVIFYVAPDLGALERAMATEAWGVKTISLDFNRLLGGPAPLSSRLKKTLMRTHRKVVPDANLIPA